MEKYIYVGPNNKKYGLMRNRVYDGSLPAYVQKAIEEVPEIAALIVEIERLHEAEAKVNRKGTPEYRAYEVVAGIR